jgi:sulfite reductase (NADPH) flavoprotein alpha-component
MVCAALGSQNADDRSAGARYAPALLFVARWRCGTAASAITQRLDFFNATNQAAKDFGPLRRGCRWRMRDGDRSSTCRPYARSRRGCGRAEGANIYVCGDAKRMAKDVERALVDIVAQFGARTTDEAVSFVAELKKKGRFQQDVY